MDTSNSAYIGFAADPSDFGSAPINFTRDRHPGKRPANNDRGFLAPALAKLETAVKELADHASQARPADDDTRHEDERCRRTVIDLLDAVDRARHACPLLAPLSDPSWKLVLQLYRASLAGRRVSITNLSSVSTLPLTTVLRCLGDLQDKTIAERSHDVHDRRRVFVAITPHAFRLTSAVLDTAYRRAIAN